MTRVVKLVFIDDDAAKRVVCDESNRTARILKIPRALLSISGDRVELDQVGIYLLIGDNEEEPDRPYVYIGETETLKKRLKDHDTAFEYFTWKTALVVVSQDAALNKAHVKHLENWWYKQLLSADSVVLKQTIPASAALNESDKAVAEDFSKTAQFLIGALGYRFFESHIKLAIPIFQQQGTPRLKLEIQLRKIIAYGKLSNAGFMVEKGSMVDPVEKLGSRDYWGPVRAGLVAQKIIGEVDGVLQFLENWTTSSPSRAAACIYGGASNGLTAWKLEATGETLKEWEAKNTVD